MEKVSWHGANIHVGIGGSRCAIALAALAAAFAASSALSDASYLNVVNSGDVTITVADTPVRPGGTIRYEVPSRQSGYANVILPPGYELTERPFYPMLAEGAVYLVPVKYRRVETSVAPVAPVAPATPSKTAAPGPRPASAPSKPGPQPSRPANTRPQTTGAKAAGNSPGTTSVNLPTLAVRTNGGEKRSGACTYGVLSLTRDGSSRPLRISASEDIPGGSSSQIRASLWQAAMTAAFLRKDPLCGIRLEREFSGFVDGPSAGGVTCLAILSALDGRAFPKDFAMTGTIMADGTIGLVGGVALKLEGAKEAGISRVCIPAFERIEKQADGSYVDLHDRARSLGIELHPVQNVEEAYAVAHHLPYVSMAPLTDSEVYCDAPAIEEAIIDFAGETASDSSSAEEAIVPRLTDDGDSIADMAFTAMRNNRNLPTVDVALLGGMYHVCIELVASMNAFWAGQGPLEKRLDKVNRTFSTDVPSHYTRWFQQTSDEGKKVSGRIVALEKKWFEDAGRAGRLSPLAAQCVAVNLESEFNNILLRTDVPAVNAGRSQESEALREVAIKRLFRREALCAWYDSYASSLNAGWRKVADALPRRNPTADTAAIEEFFFSALVAQDNAIGENLKSFSKLLVKNYDWTLYKLKVSEAFDHHARVKNLSDANDSRAAFARVVSIMCQIDALAHGSMISALFSNEIGFSLDEDGDFVFPDDKPYLSYLIRNARIEAVKAIAGCDEADLPCPRARAHVEVGDHYRDSKGYDVFDVLREYWCAMLKAKALYMVFATNPSATR